MTIGNLEWVINRLLGIVETPRLNRLNVGSIAVVIEQGNSGVYFFDDEFYFEFYF